MKGKHTNKNNSKKHNKLLTNIILLILVCIFIYSSYQVIIWIKSNKELTDLEDKLFTEVVTKIESNDENQEQSINVDFAKLQEINKDIIAWIKIDNTNINYPILQGETDQYYLRKNIYKKYSTAGSLFIDTTTKTDFSDDNTVIYGHNLRNNKMFSNLTKIYNGELGTEIYIEIYTNQSFNKYKVFSAYLSPQNTDIIQKNFNDGERENFVNNILQKSNINFNFQNDIEREIITLITCDSSGDKRIVVHAIKQ